MINSSRVVKPSFLLKLPGLLNYVYYINNHTGRQFHTRVSSTTMEQSVVSTPTKVNIVVAGEHLRTRLLSERPSLIKDRRYHLRVYPTCFVARDLVDWLIEHLEASDRNVAVKCMRVLQENNIIHHVCDDHQFKDQLLYFRFCSDDGTGFPDEESEILYKGLDLYHRILSDQKQFVLQDIRCNGRYFKTCFVGNRLVDWLVTNGEVSSRENGVEVGIMLLESGLIKQLSSEKNVEFKDDDLYYQFTIEDLKSLKLMDLLNVKDTIAKQNPYTSAVWPMNELYNIYHDVAKLNIRNSKEMNRRRHSSSATPPKTPISTSREGGLSPSPRPVVFRNVSVEELEDKRNPFVMARISVLRDTVGYGFVVRGSTPVYVQTVDPNGPGAAAGVKIRQYIYSVNGKNALRWSHKQVAQEILNSPKVIDLVVMYNVRGP